MLPVWGAYILEGLIHGGAYFRNFTVFYREKSFNLYEKIPINPFKHLKLILTKHLIAQKISLL